MLFFLLFLQGIQMISSQELVHTPYGDLRGFSYTTANHETGRVFLGIKYGFGPRFKKPYPITYYGNVDATKFGSLCPQIGGREKASRLGTTVSDDCLSLNIYAPSDSRSLVPVIVWIHGGQLQRGHGSLDPQVIIQRFVSRGVLFVSVQYRLGALGFLSMSELLNESLRMESEIDSNVGANDVILALQWIKRNIQSFGGDPKRITLSGHEAGACLISSLYLSGKVDGLLDRLFLGSGSSETCFDGSSGYRDISSKFINQVCGIDLHSQDFDSEKLKEVENCVLNREIEDFIEFDTENLLGWNLIVDGELFEGIPREMAMGMNSSEDLEIFMGITRDEWASFEMQLMRSGIKVLDPSIYNWRNVLKFVLKSMAFAFPRSEMNKKMRELADGYELTKIEKHVSSWLQITNNVLTDAFFASKIIRETEIYRNLSKNINLYEFTEPASSFSIQGYRPVMHGDDLNLLFGRKDSIAAREMAKIWTDFAKGFEGSGGRLEDDREGLRIPILGGTLDRSKWNYLEINGEGVVERRDFRRNARHLWSFPENPLYIDYPRPSREKAWIKPSLVLF